MRNDDAVFGDGIVGSCFYNGPYPQGAHSWRLHEKELHIVLAARERYSRLDGNHTTGWNYRCRPDHPSLLGLAQPMASDGRVLTEALTESDGEPPDADTAIHTVERNGAVQHLKYTNVGSTTYSRCGVGRMMARKSFASAPVGRKLHGKICNLCPFVLLAMLLTPVPTQATTPLKVVTDGPYDFEFVVQTGESDLAKTTGYIFLEFVHRDTLKRYTAVFRVDSTGESVRTAPSSSRLATATSVISSSSYLGSPLPVAVEIM